MKYHSSFILFFHPKPYFPTYKKKINKKLKMQEKKKEKENPKFPLLEVVQPLAKLWHKVVLEKSQRSHCF
jgi:hypothetical protein